MSRHKQDYETIMKQVADIVDLWRDGALDDRDACALILEQGLIMPSKSIMLGDDRAPASNDTE